MWLDTHRGHKIQGQLDHHPDASVREKNNLGRLSVLERCVSSAVQGHEEGICSGHDLGQRNVSTDLVALLAEV